MIKNQFSVPALIILGSMLFSSCEVVGGIFKAGMWSGILVVVLVFILVFWLIARSRK
ncbi:MAG: phosphatidate cytidylyltransferase [Chitinophagaceae bacterium]|nr:phosphatidate cytidylyltransferase [Chitinophagaceae bacterium]